MYVKRLKNVYFVKFSIATFFFLAFAINITAQNKSMANAADSVSLIKKYQKFITPELLEQNLKVIASDSFQGRGTGQPGQQLAAEYIASFYQSIGVSPKGTSQKGLSGSSAYFQPFTLYQNTPNETTLDIIVDGRSRLKSVFSVPDSKADSLGYYDSGGASNQKGAVVFAGYGIADDTLGYNDLRAVKGKGISIKGKWLLILGGEPSIASGSTLLNTPGHKSSEWSRNIGLKRLAIWRTGEKPLGILVIADADTFKKRNLQQDGMQKIRTLKKTLSLALTDPSKSFIPVYLISSKMANEILASSGHTVDGLRSEITRNVFPVVFDVKGAVVRSTVKAKPVISARNIFALLEGSDPVLKKEFIVLSAHYDGLGIDTSLKGDQIYNGACDDASGTVAIMEIAKILKRAKEEGNGLARSVLFAHFTGEEKGRLGSLYFTSVQPIIPLKNIAADINMDGVAGFDSKHPTGSKNYVYLNTRTGLSEDLLSITSAIKEITGNPIELTHTDERLSSDHENFWDAFVPALDFSTGYVDNIHKVTDETSTIDFEHMTNIVRLAFATLWKAGNQSNFTQRKKIAATGRFICADCGLPCDKEVFLKPGPCPYCTMLLIPQFKTVE